MSDENAADMAEHGPTRRESGEGAPRAAVNWNSESERRAAAVAEITRFHALYEKHRAAIRAEFAKLTLDQAVARTHAVGVTQIAEAISVYAQRAARAEMDSRSEPARCESCGNVLTPDRTIPYCAACQEAGEAEIAAALAEPVPPEMLAALDRIREQALDEACARMTSCRTGDAPLTLPQAVALACGEPAPAPQGPEEQTNWGGWRRPMWIGG